jgi:hypothetical protein
VVASAFLDVEKLLREAGVNLLFVASSNAEQAEGFLANYELDHFPGVLVTDPTLRCQKIFGCKNSIFHSLVTPVVQGVKTYGVKGVLEGIQLGAEIFHLAGASWLQGAMFAVRDGKIVFSHLESFPGDWPDPAKFQACCSAVTGELKGMQLSYQNGLQRWLDARDRTRQERKENGVKASFGKLQVHLCKEIFKELCVIVGPYENFFVGFFVVFLGSLVLRFLYYSIRQ